MKFNVFITWIRTETKRETREAKFGTRNSPLMWHLQFCFAMLERDSHGLVGKVLI
jgi:hypothetical protein